MTIGIYLLKFSGTNKVYVGKSLDINKRFLDHKSNFSRGQASPKLQNAYNKYGEPILEVLLECSIPELSEAEREAIEIFDAINNGYNTIPGALEDCYGENSPNAKYTNLEYYNVLKLLTSVNIGIPEIAKTTGIPIIIIRKISRLCSHTWLKEAYPEEYSKLESIFLSGGRRSRGKVPKSIVGPTGEIYEVANIRAFAKIHSLEESHLHSVLNGSRKTHKGWHLSSYVGTPSYPSIISPEGIIYTIDFGNAKEFALNHRLTYPLLYNVLTKNKLVTKAGL